MQMDDEIQSYKPDISGPNKVTLGEAQKNFKEIGRADKINYHSKGEERIKMKKIKTGSLLLKYNYSLCN
ncbi:hypothetical protein CN692_24385 [Bacillus sp. AFS002410]|nr:hypothetical protein CN692_24385 [Bacillus sp. AFS002410]